MPPAYIEVLPQSRHQLVVPGSDGKNRPFFCLPAEINNSSFSDPSYISAVFPRLKTQGFNTLLCGVGWEQIEPTEGDFRFKRLDACIQTAREEGLRLVLLWFGAFKNGQYPILSIDKTQLVT
jgi:beta-galactosidase GanA